MWILARAVAAIFLIIFWRGKNAVWGGATLGVGLGIIIAMVFKLKGNGFQWSLIINIPNEIEIARRTGR